MRGDSAVAVPFEDEWEGRQNAKRTPSHKDVGLRCSLDQMLSLSVQRTMD